MNQKQNLQHPPFCKSILIVEDDEGIRSSLKFALELEQYEVYSAADGQEGMERLKTISLPCLIFLDLMMPVMNGWEFAEALQKDSRLSQNPVVLVTAFTDQTPSICSVGIIRKPIDLTQLFQVARTWCLPPSTVKPEVVT